MVNVGDSVMQGQRIAQVGSSGKSTDPHCHFEVYKNGFIIDPFGRLCSGEPEVPAMIAFLPQYDNDLQYINSNVASGILALDSVREAPHQTFFSQRDSFITYWVHGLSIGQGNIIRTDWYEPSGTLWFTHLDTMDANYRYWYYYTYINGPAVQVNMPLGTWKVKYYVQDQPFDSLSFEIRQLGVHKESERHVSISPNPARNYILVDGDCKDIKLFDGLGRELKLQINYNTKPIRIELNGLPSGAYNLQLKDASGKMLIKKVIIK